MVNYLQNNISQVNNQYYLLEIKYQIYQNMLMKINCKINNKNYNKSNSDQKMNLPLFNHQHIFNYNKINYKRYKSNRLN